MTAPQASGPVPEALEKLLAKGTDNALLRMGLALAYHRRGEWDRARGHVEQALLHQPGFAAAGRLRGLIALEQGEPAVAAQAFAQALEAARRQGERQLERELAVRLKRLQPPASTAQTK